MALPNLIAFEVELVSGFSYPVTIGTSLTFSPSLTFTKAFNVVIATSLSFATTLTYVANILYDKLAMGVVTFLKKIARVRMP